MKLNPNEIIIGERQRIDLGDLQDLATSLSDLGQINAITVEKQVDGKYYLVTGRRRLGAALLLGWTSIEVKDHGALDPLLKERIELEEDIKRKERTWQEKCIATAKLHKMLVREKVAEGLNWTYRNMETFTGISKTQIGYMIQMADCFRAVPRDEAMWGCENYTDGVKLLIQRQYDETNGELERRRAKTLQAASQPVLTQTESPSLVPEKDTTLEEAAPDKVRIRLQGRLIDFGSCVEDEHIIADRGSLLIARKTVLMFSPSELKNIRLILANDGFAVLFLPTLNEWTSMRSVADEFNMTAMSYPFIWNKLTDEETYWPFYHSVEYGLILTRQHPHRVNNRAASSIITAAPSDDNLAYPVVEHIISTVTFEAAPVYCFGSVNPTNIAACGRIPIFFDSDEVQLAQKKQSLKEHYEASVPNAEVVF